MASFGHKSSYPVPGIAPFGHEWSPTTNLLGFVAGCDRGVAAGPIAPRTPIQPRVWQACALHGQHVVASRHAGAAVSHSAVHHAELLVACAQLARRLEAAVRAQIFFPLRP